MVKERVVLWFRQDLRLHDNEALYQALKQAREIVPVFVLDERQIQGKTKFGFPKMGSFRCKFLLESIADLRNSLRLHGADLIVRMGIPEVVIRDLAAETRSTAVFCNRERTSEEVAVQDALEKMLWLDGRELVYFRGKMLFHTADLPFPVAHTPDIFTHFRKEVERIVPVREPLPAPNQVFTPLTVSLESGMVPTMASLGMEDVDNAGLTGFIGGESAALERLSYYLWESERILEYKETRNGLLGRDFSSRFSPYLAMGCLSPKTIYHEIRRFERERRANESTYWLVFELLWRDFFRLMGKKYKDAIFRLGGPRNVDTSAFRYDESLFWKWANGETGVPFIDANMRELNKTGFMSNRGRQVVASFLAKEMRINWVAGAEYFESLLLDYDVCSNYGNWNYVAGVGSDPREDRIFNVQSQASRYDASGSYTRRWLPELSSVPPERLLQFPSLDAKELVSYGVYLGSNYPKLLTRKPSFSGPT